MPKRSLNGYRDYSDEDVDRINRIKLLRLAGVPVKQIQEYFSDQKPVEEILQHNEEK